MVCFFQNGSKYKLNFSFVSSPVIALHCWGCISHLNRGCGDPFNSSELHKLDWRECSGKCAKLIYNNSDGAYDFYIEQNVH